MSERRGGFGVLEEDTARTCAQYLYTIRGEETMEHQANILHNLVI